MDENAVTLSARVHIRTRVQGLHDKISMVLPRATLARAEPIRAVHLEQVQNTRGCKSSNASDIAGQEVDMRPPESAWKLRQGG